MSRKHKPATQPQSRTEMVGDKLENIPARDEQMRAMQAQMAGIQAAVEAKTPNTVDKLVGRIASPFTQEVIDHPLPLKFKISIMDMFDGFKDPVDHLKTFKALMHLQVVLDEII